MSDAVISVCNLHKRYGSTEAVQDVCFEVGVGEIFGLLGPNGAGKTTTLECIEGIRRRSDGTISVCGFDPQTGGRAFRKCLGVQLQSSALPGAMLAGEALRLVGAWQDTSASKELIDCFGLEPLLKKQYRSLSTGQKRRLHLALALISSPRAVILDEPTAGLDVEGRVQLHTAIKRLKAKGVTVLLATHDMAEAEELCDRLAIIIKGRVAVTGTPAQVTAAGSGGTRISVRTAHSSLAGYKTPECAAFTGSDGGYFRYTATDTAKALIIMLNVISESGDTVEDLRVERPSLEERFMEIVEGKIQ